MNPQRPVILAADDEADSPQLLADILQKVGYEVRAANSSKLALASVVSHASDLILL
jgi:CheY-like chemotaxis protein